MIKNRFPKSWLLKKGLPLATFSSTTKESKVVVIGSGIGGLTSAAILAKRGYGVTVLEKHTKPGGYVTCFEKQKGTLSLRLLFT